MSEKDKFSVNVPLAANTVQKARLLSCYAHNTDAITYIVNKYEALIKENRKLNQKLNALRHYEDVCPACGVNLVALNELKKACGALFE